MKMASAKELDKMFEAGEDMTDYIDFSSAVRINAPRAENESVDTEVKRVNVDFPVWMVEELDKQANLLAINRQAVIKTWIADRLLSTTH